MTKKEDSKDNLISQLHKDWQQLEQLGSQPVPSKAAIKEQLMLAKSEKRKAFYKELTFFITIALLILIGMTTVIFKAPLFFIWIQALSLVAAPMIYLILSKRKAKEASFYDR